MNHKRKILSRTLLTCALALMPALLLSAESENWPSSGKKTDKKEFHKNSKQTSNPKAGDRIRKNPAMNQEDRELIMLRRLLNMPPEKLEKLKQAIARFENMSENEKDELRQRIGKFREMSPQKREKMRKAFQKMPEERRKKMREYWNSQSQEEKMNMRKKLKNMDSDEREQWRQKIMR